MLEERENQGRSVHPGPHFRQAPHARLGGPKAPASRIPEAPTGVSPSPQGARAAPAPPSPAAQARPGPGRNPAGDRGSCVFEEPQSLRCFRRRAPQSLLGPDHSGKSPANRGAPGPPRDLLLGPQPLLETRSAWAPTGRRPPPPAPGPTIPSENKSERKTSLRAPLPSALSDPRARPKFAARPARHARARPAPCPGLRVPAVARATGHPGRESGAARTPDARPRRLDPGM